MRKFAPKIRFQRVNLITIISLYILILAGGIVRSTGSGMGCPDWPKCFGQYIPPISSADLPADYKQKYVEKRVVKNQRFAKTLDFFGYSALARIIRGDKSILVPEEFNAAKTWTEYINRLIGMISGLLLLLTAVLSFSYRKENVLIPILSVVNLFLVFFQAWLGSIVVSTNLVAWVVTLHMLLALALVGICIYTYQLAKVYGKRKINTGLIVKLVNFFALTITIVQIVFGTEVREKIDAVSTRLQGGYREDWISNIGMVFYHHREMAVLVLAVNIILFVLIRGNFNKHSVHQQVMSLVFLLIMLQIVTGILLAYWSLPPIAQASHIILSSMLFGAQFYLMLNLFYSVTLQEAKR